MQRVYGDYAILADPQNSEQPWILGEGVFGVTYRAKHGHLGHEVALKVLRPEYGDNRGLEKFVREAKTLKDLHHPNIASYDYVGVGNDEQPYCAMEFCDGGDLESISKHEGGIPAPQVAEIGRQVCGALAEAHAKGYVHRDIKPSNLMLKRQDEHTADIKVIDFGLAHSMTPDEDSEEAVRSTHGFKGTSLFASPEQLRRQKVDGRSDLYSLGICLWFLLKGRRPSALNFDNSAEISAAHLDPKPFDLKNIDPILVPVMSRLLEKSVDERYPDAETAMRDFAACVVEYERQSGEAVDLGSLPLKPVDRFEDTIPSEPEQSDLLLGEYFSQIGKVEWECMVGPVYRAIRAEDNQESGIVLVGEYLAGREGGRYLSEENFLTLHRLVSEHVQFSRDRNYPEGIIAPLAFHWFRNGEIAVECEPVHGVIMQDVLRERGRIEFSKLLPMLASFAESLDYLQARGLPGPSLYESQLILQIRGFQRHEYEPLLGESLEGWPHFLLRVSPLRLPGDVTGSATQSESVSNTGTIMGGSAANADDKPVAGLAAKIYRFIGGRPVAQAAWMTPEAFSNVAGLGPEGNEILRSAISSGGKGYFQTCTELLQALCEAEGVSMPVVFSSVRDHVPSSGQATGDGGIITLTPGGGGVGEGAGSTPSGPPPVSVAAGAGQATREKPAARIVSASQGHVSPSRTSVSISSVASPSQPAGAPSVPQKQKRRTRQPSSRGRSKGTGRGRLVMTLVIGLLALGGAAFAVMKFFPDLIGSGGKPGIAGPGTGPGSSVPTMPGPSGSSGSSSSGTGLAGSSGAGSAPPGAGTSGTGTGSTTSPSTPPTPAGTGMGLTPGSEPSPGDNKGSGPSVAGGPGGETQPPKSDPSGGTGTGTSPGAGATGDPSGVAANTPATNGSPKPGPGTSGSPGGTDAPPTPTPTPTPETKPPAPPADTSTPAGRMKAYGTTAETKLLIQVGQEWVFQFENGEWITTDRPLRGQSPVNMNSQCSMWTQVDRGKRLLHPDFSYYPHHDTGKISIRKGASAAVSSQPASKPAVPTGPNVIGVWFNESSRHYKEPSYQYFEIKENSKFPEADVMHIKDIDGRGLYPTRQVNDLIYRFSNGKSLTFESYYNYHQ